MANEVNSECVTGLLVNISPVRPKDLSAMAKSSCTDKLPPTAEEKLLEDEVFDFDISASPPFDDNSENADQVTFHRLSALSPRQVAELCEQANRVAACFLLATEDLRSTPKRSTVDVDDGETATEALDDIRCPEVKQTENLPVLSSSVVPSVTEAGAGVPVVPRSRTKGKVVPLVRSSGSAMKENRAPASSMVQSSGRKASSGVSEVKQFMVRKSSSAVASRQKQSLASTSMSSTDSVSSSASAASATARLTTTRPAADTPMPATDRGTTKLSRAKSSHLHPVAKPLPVPRRPRPSLSTAQYLNTTSEVKQTAAAQLPMKRRPESTKSVPSEKVAASSAAVARKPSSGQSSSAAVASKPPAGKPRMVVKGATSVSKFNQKK